MGSDGIEFVLEMITFLIRRLFDLIMLLYELFWGVVKIGFVAGFAYMIAMIAVGFPCTIIESITKIKVPEEVQSKIKATITVCLTLCLVYILLRDEYPVN